MTESSILEKEIYVLKAKMSLLEWDMPNLKDDEIKVKKLRELDGLKQNLKQMQKQHKLLLEKEAAQ